jgi:hypothetical protein
MAQIGMIGLEREELQYVQDLVQLLRNPDPVIAELARQAIAYLENVAAQSGGSSAERLPQAAVNATT